MRAVLLVVLLGCVLAPASAQTVYWSENFDSYPTGQLASGTGGWYGWDNVPAALGDIVAGPANSAPNSLQIDVGDDTIYPFVLNDPAGYPRSCTWQLTAYWYIPSSTFVAGSANQFFIVQNTYNHGGPYTWAIQLEANPDTMLVADYYRASPAPVPVILDQWVLIQADIDLDNDTLTLSYGGQVVCTGTWTTGPGDPLEIACIDLFTTSTSNIAYFDDLTLVQMTGPEYQANQPGASLDLNGLVGSACGPSLAAFSGGTLTTLNLGSTNANAIWDLALTVPEPTVPLSAGGVLTPGGQIVNVNVVAPSFFFLNPPFPFVSASLPFYIPAAPFQVSAQMVVLDATLPDFFALSQAIEIASIPCVNPQNFDSLPTGSGVYPGGWSDGGGTTQWTVHTGSTSSQITGPTGANSLPNYYYCETSGTAGQNYKVNTCIFDTTGIANPTVNFALSRIGQDMGTLIVKQDDGTGTFPITLMTYTGFDPAQSQGVNEWSAESLPIDTMTPGAIARFQLDYTSSTTSSTFYWADLAIDDFVVQ